MHGCPENVYVCARIFLKVFQKNVAIVFAWVALQTSRMQQHDRQEEHLSILTSLF